MFRPTYTITEKLLANIKRINSLVGELNNRRFPRTVLVELEREARVISSFASTSIEGNPLPITDVKKILKNRPENIRDSEREVLNYNQALKYLNEKIKKLNLVLNTEQILKIQRMVMIGLVPNFLLGKFRTDAVFVNDPRLRKTIYWPPDYQDVEILMGDLVEFVKVNKDKIDPLILAGIFHKQFVIIHPFMDGNGRTARLCTKVLLTLMGLNTFNLFSFENYYNKNVSNYFKNVGAFGNYYDIFKKIDYTEWLEYFTDGIIDELLRVGKALSLSVVTPDRELMDYHKKILDFISKKGYIKDSDYAKLTDRAKATRNLDFKKLIKMGLIAREGKGRATYYKLKV